MEERQSSSGGFLTIVPESAVLTMFISMCSGQETDKLLTQEVSLKGRHSDIHL